MTTLAVIIARTGSKGLPNKSMQLLGGNPLVAWTIEHACNSRLVDQVVLTTDGLDIARVGRAHGILVYQRPPELARDDVTIDVAVRHGVTSWEQAHGRQASLVAIMYANVVLRPPDLTDRALARMIQTKADSVQSVYPVGKMHPLWMRTVGQPDGRGPDDALGMYQPNRIYRRQDLPPVYMLDAGAIAVTRSSLFSVDPAEPHAFLGSDRRGIITAPGDVVDVDVPVDLRIAEAVLADRQGRAASAPVLAASWSTTPAA